MSQPVTGITDEAGSERPSRAVLEAVADAEGVTPLELDRPLYGAVDPEALDALFEPELGRTTTGNVRFTYLGYEVTVHGDGSVELVEA